MSLEKAIAELAESVDANTAAIKESLTIQEAALAAIGEKPKTTGRGKGGGQKASGKGRGTGRGPGRPKKLTPEDVRDACRKFLDTDDKDLHEDRERFVKAIASEFDCKPAEVDEEDRQVVINYINSATENPDIALGWAEKREDGRKITFAKYLDQNVDEGGDGDDDLTG